MSDRNTHGYTYKDAGVDIDAGASLVEAIGPLAASTARTGTTAQLGGFGAAFDLAQTGYKDPVLVASTDGVGTKLLVAREAGRHRGIGIDLVAMCVNDVVVEGAEPLFFLDYFATGRLEESVAKEVIQGVAEGCRDAGCALIGGETAELPGLYARGHYDLAGFVVGAVERTERLSGAGVAPGDVVLGMASSGLHSNGFSLVRRIIESRGHDYAARAPFDEQRALGDALLAPTRIYVRSCLGAIREGGIKALAHITGGGLIENPPRVLPEGTAVRFDAHAWPLPPVFRWLARDVGVSVEEMARTFNCGIGMMAVVSAADADRVATGLIEAGESVYRIGEIVARDAGAPASVIDNMQAAWRD